MKKLNVCYGIVSAITGVCLIAYIIFQSEILKYFLAAMIIIWGITEIIRGVQMLKTRKD